MVNYNEIFDRKAGVIPIKKYPIFFRKFGKFLKTTNRKVIYSYHEGSCATCGKKFSMDALMHLNDHGPKVMTKTGKVTTGEDAKARRLVANICPWCSSRDMKIRIVKLKIEALKGTFHTVFICGEVKGDMRKYKKAEGNMTRWVKKTQASHLTPQTQVVRSQVRQLPDSRNRKGVDSFISSQKIKKSLAVRKQQFEIFNKGGYRFLVVYI